MTALVSAVWSALGRGPTGLAGRDASRRIVGLDVARALAILGMVLVNVRGKAHAYGSDYEWLVWASDRVEGKFAALFVLLAGIGISLRSRGFASASSDERWTARRALLERAAIVFGLGLLNLHLWSWDILHFYGVYLSLAALMLGVSNRALWGLAVAFTVGGLLAFINFDWWQPTEFWTLTGALRKLFFNGLHPVLPWMTFLLVGMWLGRQDLADRRLRRTVLAVAIAVLGLAELGDWAARPGPDGPAPLLGWEHKDLLRAWPRPARPGFVASGTAFAALVVCLAIEFTQRRRDAGWVIALTATGQLALTIYLAHAVAIVILMQHAVLLHPPVEVAFAWGLGFYAIAVAASVWWRRRWADGPLEGLMRQVIDR